MNSIESMLYDFLVDNDLATDAEITLVTNINGWSEESLNDIIWARTEYKDVEQIYACEPNTFYISDALKEYYGLGEEEEDEEDEEEEEEE